MVLGAIKARLNKRKRPPRPPLPPLTIKRYAILEQILINHGVPKPTRQQVEHVHKFPRPELEAILKQYGGE